MNDFKCKSCNSMDLVLSTEYVKKLAYCKPVLNTILVCCDCLVYEETNTLSNNELLQLVQSKKALRA